MIPNVSKRKRNSSEQVVPGTTNEHVHRGVSSSSEHERRKIGHPNLPLNPFDNPDYPIRNFQQVYSRMRDPQTGLKLADGRWRFLTYSKCFSGALAVQWMVDNLSYDREEAVHAGQLLMDAGIIHHVTHSEPFCDAQFFYRFQEDDDTNILNMKRLWDASIPTREAVLVSKDLLTRLAFLCEEHRKYLLDTDPDSPQQSKNDSTINIVGHGKDLNDGANVSRNAVTAMPSPILPDPATPRLSDVRPSGPSNPTFSSNLSPLIPTTPSASPFLSMNNMLNMSSSSLLRLPSVASVIPLNDDVDYSMLARSDRFRHYTLAAAELQQVQLCALSHDERIAFFVNIYNALCLHAHVVHGPPNSVLRRYTFFRALSYRVGGLDLTLDDIEHGILRGNKRPPMIKFLQQLRPSDPKCQFVITKRDGRIHFVISAGTKSDPPIRILDGENVQEELHDATVEFLSITVKVDLDKRSVTLPRILYWYAEDFPKPEKSLLLWVVPYLPTATANQLVNMVNGEGSMPSVTYENFDWCNAEARFNASVVRRKRRRLERERSSSMPNGGSPDLARQFANQVTAITPIISPDPIRSLPLLPALPTMPTMPPDFSRPLIPVENIDGDGNGTGVGNTSPFHVPTDAETSTPSRP